MRSDTTILLVGTHATLMGAIAARLEYEHHCKIVGIVGSPKEAARKLAENRPEIILADFDTLGTQGRASLRKLHDAHPDVRILLLAERSDDPGIKQALAIGARGFLLKGQLPGAIAKAIRQVLTGKTCFPDDMPADNRYRGGFERGA